MINYYQPFLLPFLQTKKYRLPDTVRQTLFLSFEDALWTLLSKRNVPKGSTILIPDFYCMDVVENIKNHGYNTVFYQLDDALRIPSDILNGEIKKHAPAVLILFHACGISVKTTSEIRTIAKKYPRLIVIEDAVHRFVNPENIVLAGNNHYLLDSLRKVSPLYGSYLYSTQNQPPILPEKISSEWKYYVSAVCWFVLFRIMFVLGMTTRNSGLIRFSHEHILKRHDDIIGDSTHGYAGLRTTNSLHRFMDFSKIEKKKRSQAEYYEKYLSSLRLTFPNWKPVPMTRKDKGQLHVYPIMFTHRNASGIRQEIEKALHKKHVPLWFKYPDAPWCKRRGVLFLPLGFHIRSRDITQITAILESIRKRV